MIAPHYLRWDIDGTRARDGVDPQNVQHKYGSGAGSVSGVDTPKNWPHFGTHIVIKILDGSSCRKCIISTSATYIWHTCEKVKKIEFTVENGIDQ